MAIAIGKDLDVWVDEGDIVYLHGEQPACVVHFDGVMLHAVTSRGTWVFAVPTCFCKTPECAPVECRG